MTKLQRVQEFGKLVKMFQETGNVEYYRMAMNINL